MFSISTNISLETCDKKDYLDKKSDNTSNVSTKLSLKWYLKYLMELEKKKREKDIQ